MRVAPVAWILALAGCAAGPAAPRAPAPRPAPAVVPAVAPDVDPAADVARVASLRARRSWPTEIDRDRWYAVLARADAAAASGDAAALHAAAFDLEQLDGIYRVGESARTRR